MLPMRAARSKSARAGAACSSKPPVRSHLGFVQPRIELDSESVPADLPVAYFVGGSKLAGRCSRMTASQYSFPLNEVIRPSRSPER